MLNSPVPGAAGYPRREIDELEVGSAGDGHGWTGSCRDDPVVAADYHEAAISEVLNQTGNASSHASRRLLGEPAFDREGVTPKCRRAGGSQVGPMQKSGLHYERPLPVRLFCFKNEKAPRMRGFFVCPAMVGAPGLEPGTR